ncbi:MAG: amidohydrolase [Deltaproteobacteria bacterium]|nr:amidohydrolase [Deltaproteobacteria bacterium]
MKRKTSGVYGLLLLLGGLACGPDRADLVFRGGGVYTLDADRPWAESVVVDGGKIIAVGSDADMAVHIGAGTDVIDLEGRMLLPGFQDSHTHPILGASLEPLCRLDDATSEEAILEAVAVCARESSDDWLLAFGWRSSLFLPEIDPRKEALDAVVSDRPVVLIAKDMHTFWLNSRALEAVGVTRGTETPRGGVILRDPRSGEPTGALRDLALDLVIDVMPRPNAFESLLALHATLGEMNRLGYTSLLDARVNEREMAWAYRLLEIAGQLDMRVSLAALYEPQQGLAQREALRKFREDFDSERLQARVVKIFVDGGTAMGASASAPRANGRPSAAPYIDEAALAEVVVALHADGLAVHLHTLGDRATRSALDAIEAAKRAHPDEDPRHVITHLVHPDPTDLARFAPLGVTANISPWWAFRNEWTASFLPTLGPERERWMYPFASLERSGVRLAAGSDYPFTPLDPFEAIEVGLTRRDPADPSSPPLVAEEALTLETLLAAYTINAAYQLHQEDRTGSIEPGKLADLIVIDRNLFETEAESISEVRVLLTLLEGEVVHRGESL